MKKTYLILFVLIIYLSANGTNSIMNREITFITDSVNVKSAKSHIKGYGYTKFLTIDNIDTSSARERDLYIIDEILKYSSFTIEYKAYRSNIQDAVALTIEGEQFILYDPKFLDNIEQMTKSSWASISILAHTVAHHLLLSDPAQEEMLSLQILRADQFSGFILYKMGATKEEATLAIKALKNQNNEQDNPNKKERIEHIIAGWEKASAFHLKSAAPPLANLNPNSYHDEFVYTPDMFFEEYDFKTSKFYQKHKLNLDNPTIYEVVIIDKKPKWRGVSKDYSLTSDRAIYIEIIRVHKTGRNTSFKKGDRLWVSYSYPYYHTSMAEQRNFIPTLYPGNVIQLSVVEESENNFFMTYMREAKTR